jgi:hypothetical protein
VAGHRIVEIRPDPAPGGIFEQIGAQLPAL